MPRKQVSKSVKGSATITAGEKEYTLHLDMSQLADLDEYIGDAFLSKWFASMGLNAHLARAAFYFAVRENHREIKSVKEAGRILDGVGLRAAAEAITAALIASGVVPDGDEDVPGEA
jgi:hypothetical protein